MGLEALTYGLLGAIGGGAKAAQDKAMFEREQEAKREDERARTERELAIEEQRMRLRAQFEKDNLPNELEKITAKYKAEAQARKEADPAAEELKRAQAAKAWNDVERDKEARAFEKDIERQRQDLAKAKQLAKNDPSLQPLVDARQTKLDTMLGNRNKNDPLSSGVAAAKAVLADFDASEDEKATARNFLANALQGQGGQNRPAAQDVRYDSAGNGYIKGPDGKPQLASKAK